MINRRRFLSGVAASSTAAAVGAQYGRAAAGVSLLDVDSPSEPRDRPTRVAWLDQNSSAMTSLDFEATYSDDLASFRAAVGDARIVMLGEQTHHEGVTFRAKARLVRFLHEEMGFDVLAFESGLYEMKNAWERIRGGQPAREAVLGGMFWFWACSREVLPLIDYIGARANGPRPLELAGFDCQFTRGKSPQSIADGFSDFVARQAVDVSALQEWPAFLSLLRDVEGDPDRKPTPAEMDMVISNMDRLDEAIANQNGREVAFWRQLFKSVKANLQVSFERKPEITLPDFNRRDVAMADNLLWLARAAYPDRKIIVWAATYHAMRNPHLIHSDDPVLAYQEVTTMGHLVAKELGDAVYTVACTSYEGSFGGTLWNKTMRLQPAPADTLEDVWAGTSHDNAFLDLRHLPAGAWLRQEQLGRLAFGYLPATAVWGQIVDGIVFLRTMTPATRGQ
jgi:erythromycin esterase